MSVTMQLKRNQFIVFSTQGLHAFTNRDILTNQRKIYEISIHEILMAPS